ncbi:unnamed protein product [Rotaria sp. Silwood2]|nr:unnamed protein product [Rotaria sp. Silwood2]CAF3069048.1 unnamed protein product [Rotaria sp. Silwood2]CAF3347974.1 unnamed protein product [Rotaria sp. Silwood2]CAF4151825.1 unnamed protein product [Rotaria sp. Silwood2]CAF4208855.1 unnamed protein product [Rotaria sp. Silwood2]
MEPAKMEKSIKKRNHIHKKNKKCDSIRHTINAANIYSITGKTNQYQKIITTPPPSAATANLNKRKQDVSLQQLSITKDSMSILQQPSAKKMMNITKTMSIDPIINANNNTSMNINTSYRNLMRSSSILCQILSKTLNYSLKKNDEQRFIYEPLKLLDEQYCLEMDQQLWKSYLDIGLQQYI